MFVSLISNMHTLLERKKRNEKSFILDEHTFSEAVVAAVSTIHNLNTIRLPPEHQGPLSLFENNVASHTIGYYYGYGVQGNNATPHEEADVMWTDVLYLL